MLRRRLSRLAHLFKATTQQHHRELAPLFRRFIPADGTVFDVGAHAGQFSKLFARLAPRGQVFAFEPSSYARSILAPALAAARVHNVEIVPVGLSDRAGEAVLHTPIKASGSLGYGIAHLGDADGLREIVTQRVALTTLDAFAAERGLDRLDFVKADVEGWEARVLAGGRETIARLRPALWLEIIADNLARAGDAPRAVFDPLCGLGYRPFLGPQLQPVNGYEGPGDYLFAPLANRASTAVPCS
jgi:FkbM family methyltransferase